MSPDHRGRVSGLPPELARRPFRVLRPRDADRVYALPPEEFKRLADRGVLHKIATGYYAVVPPGSTDRHWLPGLEAAAYGIGSADYGPDRAVLMGLSAARLQGAIPRALSVAVVAVEASRRPLALGDRKATVRFVRRNTTRLDAERITTDLGPALVTTVEQTLLDLAHRPDVGGVSDEAADAVRALWPRADSTRLTEIALEQRMKAALVRARDWAGA
jgi:predicted transcriptional regulator of viral defense system